MIRAGSRVSRALALALLAGLVGLAGVTVVKPLAERWTELRDRRAETAEMLARFRTVAAQRDAQAREHETARRTIASAGLYLEAESQALAGARMGETLRRIAERHGGELRSVRVLDGQDPGHVALHAAMNGDWAAIFPVLHAIETSDPYFLLRAFSISARSGRSAEPGGEDRTIEIEFEMHGYLPPEITG